MNEELKHIVYTVALAKEYKRLSYLLDPNEQEKKKLVQILGECVSNEFLSDLVHEISSDIDEIYHQFQQQDRNKNQDCEKISRSVDSIYRVSSKS